MLCESYTIASVLLTAIGESDTSEDKKNSETRKECADVKEKDV